MFVKISSCFVSDGTSKGIHKETIRDVYRICLAKDSIGRFVYVSFMSDAS